MSEKSPPFSAAARQNGEIKRNAVNYDARMSEILSSPSVREGGKKLLLHSCCAPCSSACLERVKDVFFVTVFYYNPNIDDVAEYEKRKAEQIRFLRETGWADFLDCDHDAAAFAAVAKGREHCEEGGARCYECYKLRLFKTAETAKREGYDYFTTTLSVSPYKRAEWLNSLGYAAQGEYGVSYLPADFKKRGGYLRSIRLSEEHGLYRQDYCGCIYSQRERSLRAALKSETKTERASTLDREIQTELTPDRL